MSHSETINRNVKTDIFFFVNFVRLPEAVVRSCSVEKVFLAKIRRKTHVSDTLF